MKPLLFWLNYFGAVFNLGFALGDVLRGVASLSTACSATIGLLGVAACCLMVYCWGGEK